MLNKIMIIGVSGSGKTTLSQQLHDALGLPVIHLDYHYWLPNWQPLSLEDWNSKLNELCQQKSWIMDGNYTQSLSSRLVHADFVIFLDMSRWLCMLRVVYRVFRFNPCEHRADMAPGCREHFNLKLLRWIWAFPQRSRGEILDQLRKIPTEKRAIISSKHELKQLVQQLQTMKQVGGLTG